MKRLFLWLSELIMISLTCFLTANALQIGMNAESWMKLTLPEDHYVNIVEISTEYGDGISVNTIGYPGAREYGYEFFAYSDETFVAPLSGAIEVTGYFMYNDITPHADRKQLSIYLLRPDLSSLVEVTRILDYVSGDMPGVWYYRRVCISNLTSGEEFKVAFGRSDGCDMERRLEASWAAIDVFLGRRLMVPDDYSTIQEAITEASDGTTIEVAPGTYYEHLTVDKDNLTITGDNCESTIIDASMDSGSNHTAVAIFGNYVVFKGFTVCSCLNGSGIAVYGHNTTLVENNVANNSIGISLHTNSNKIVKTNVFNNVYGVWIKSRIKGTEITCNNFINNTYPHVLQHPTGANRWDNGYIGNFWSDYTAIDLDGDGIADYPYEIAANNTDYYPLMNPYWNPADVNHDLKVDIYDVVMLSGAYSSTPLDPNWSSHCDVVAPYGIIDIYDVVFMCGYYGEVYKP